MCKKRTKIVFCGPSSEQKTKLIEQLFLGKEPFDKDFDLDDEVKSCASSDGNGVRRDKYCCTYSIGNDYCCSRELRVWECGNTIYYENGDYPLKYTDKTLFIYVVEREADINTDEVKSFLDNYSYRGKQDDFPCFFVSVSINEPHQEDLKLKKLLYKANSGKVIETKKIIDDYTFCIGRDSGEYDGLSPYFNYDCAEKLKQRIIRFAKNNSIQINNDEEKLYDDMCSKLGEKILNREVFRKECDIRYINDDSHLLYKFESAGLIHRFHFGNLWASGPSREIICGSFSFANAVNEMAELISDENGPKIIEQLFGNECEPTITEKMFGLKKKLKVTVLIVMILIRELENRQ